MLTSKEDQIEWIKQDIAHLAILAEDPTEMNARIINMCSHTRNDCPYCPYDEGIMNGGCCLGLYTTACTAHSEFTSGRMSWKRYAHRLLTLRDWLERKLDELENE